MVRKGIVILTSLGTLNPKNIVPKEKNIVPLLVGRKRFHNNLSGFAQKKHSQFQKKVTSLIFFCVTQTHPRDHEVGFLQKNSALRNVFFSERDSNQI